MDSASKLVTPDPEAVGMVDAADTTVAVEPVKPVTVEPTVAGQCLVIVSFFFA